MTNLFSISAGHPLLSLIIAAAAILMLTKIVRLTFRLTLAAVIFGFILVVFYGYSPKEVLTKGGEMASSSATYVEDTINPAIYNGLKNAHVKKGPNGTFEFVGDQFEIGETPQGKFIFNIKPLHISLTQDELSKYIGKQEMQNILQILRDKTNSL